MKPKDINIHAGKPTLLPVIRPKSAGYCIYKLQRFFPLQVNLTYFLLLIFFAGSPNLLPLITCYPKLYLQPVCICYQHHLIHENLLVTYRRNKPNRYMKWNQGSTCR